MTETTLPAERLVHGRVVDLERAAPGRYEGTCHGGWVRTRAYGGAVLAQGVGAAADTVEEGRGLDSLHAYFVAAVDPTKALHYEVVPLREGRRYSVCRVEATQADRDGEQRRVFTMNASFKRPEPGTRQRRPACPLDGIPGPEDCHDGFAVRGPDSPIAKILDNREAGGLDAAPGELRRANWMRMRHAIGEDPVAQAAALVYLTDVTLAPTAFGVEIGLNRPERSVIASLDHALWLHVDPAAVRADDWLCFVQTSRLQEDGRTFARGELWTPDGVLVASVAQEALIRHLEPTDPH